jgi:signal transduction histidine kinase
VNDFSSPENEFEKLPGMWAKVMQGETRLFEWKAKRYHDGFEFDVEVFLRKLDLPGDSVILATVRDITEKKQARLALQKAHDELEEKVEERTVDLARAVRILREEIRERKRLEKEKEKIQSQLFQSQKMEAVGKLAGGVAHDFNNLIGIIQGYATLLIDELKENPDSGKYLNEILKAAKSSEKLINQLLVFSRQKEIQKEKIVLNSLIKDMMGMLRPILGEQIELETDFQPDLFPVYGDVTNFEQIILNLAVNARDAMEETGGSIRIETRNVEFNDKNLPGIQGLNPGQYVKMVFSDTGSGMSEETLQHVFEPFFTTKAEGKGTGLGLAVIYSIVRNHRGIVYVESETGKGTRFYFYFPAYGDVR